MTHPQNLPHLTKAEQFVGTIVHTLISQNTMNEISTIKNHTEYRKLQISQYNHRCGNTRIFLDIAFFSS